MSFHNVDSKTITMTSMTGIMPKIQRDFEHKCHSKAITYDTPAGSFTIRLNVLSERTEEIRLVAKEALEYPGPCGNTHSNEVEIHLQSTVKFMSSSMSVESQADFSDQQIIAKVKEFAQKHNDFFKKEQIFLPFATNFRALGYYAQNGQYHSLTRP